MVIKVSELLRDDQAPGVILNDEVLGQLEAVIAELAGPGKIVELIRE